MSTGVVSQAVSSGFISSSLLHSPIKGHREDILQANNPEARISKECKMTSTSWNDEEGDRDHGVKGYDHQKHKSTENKAIGFMLSSVIKPGSEHGGWYDGNTQYQIGLCFMI